MHGYIIPQHHSSTAITAFCGFSHPDAIPGFFLNRSRLICVGPSANGLREIFWSLLAPVSRPSFLRTPIDLFLLLPHPNSILLISPLRPFSSSSKRCLTNLHNGQGRSCSVRKVLHGHAGKLSSQPLNLHPVSDYIPSTACGHSSQWNCRRCISQCDSLSTRIVAVVDGFRQLAAQLRNILAAMIASLANLRTGLYGGFLEYVSAP